jgi:hypothetical protein
MSVKVISLFEYHEDPNGIYVNTTSKADSDWQRDLSPFYLGPCPLYWDLSARIMENAWQFSKVYPEYDNDGEPTEKYFDWANKGWNSKSPQRYPMGKGKKPLYSWWDGKTYTYVEARKKIYIPLYARAVVNTKGFKHLQELYLDVCAANLGVTDSALVKTIYLKDYDAYRHEDKGMTLTDVMNNPDKKMGHAFVLMMLLTRDPAVLQTGLCA